MRAAISCLLALLITAAAPESLFADAYAMDEPPTCLQVTWQAVAADCEWSYSDYASAVAAESVHTWVVTIHCGNGGICTEHIECTEGGATGLWHDVYMDGTDVGDVCVPEDKVDTVSIARLVIREFKRIKWPASKLIVQPPGGKTLVNFRTNFYTPDHQAIDQTVTIADKTVVIRAVPASYTFHFGDGTSTETDNPGRPHPHLDVTHVYAKAEPVVVGLDTTYVGEYRIGQGEWVSIPDALTVSGAGQDLAVVEAIPQLVLR